MKRTLRSSLLRSGCILIVSAVVSIPEYAFAHGGGLDSKGCHTNRKSGDYHCHSPQSSPPPRPSSQAPLSDPSLQLSSDFVWKNCSEARAAGAAPVLRGEPGYGLHLDRDGDGVGCE